MAADTSVTSVASTPGLADPGYVDVWGTDELLPPPAGHRYLDFMGGAKHLRCYIVPESTARCDFLESSGHLLDDELLGPIVERDGITIRQDASFAIPGFYVLGFTKQYRALDAIPETQFLEAAKLLRECRVAMRAVLGIEHAHVLYEEKPHETCSVHFWILPVDDVWRDDPENAGIERLDLRGYLRRTTLPAKRSEIIRANRLMRGWFSGAGRVDDAAAATTAEGKGP